MGGKDGTEYDAVVQTLPTVVEAWKTYDDVHLVKALEVGQVITVREAGAPAPQSVESRDGFMPAMADVRKRQFRKVPILPADDVAEAEARLAKIVAAPGRSVSVCVTEEFVDLDEVDPPPFTDKAPGGRKSGGPGQRGGSSPAAATPPNSNPTSPRAPG